MPQLDGTVKLERLTAAVRVRTDAHGIPVIAFCVRAAGPGFGASERLVVAPGHFEDICPAANRVIRCPLITGISSII